MSQLGFLVLLTITVGCTKKTEPVAPAPVAADPIAELQKTLEAAPSYENHIALGLKLSETGQSPEAIAMYKKATEINADGPLAWSNICAEFNKQNKFADALPNCEKAVALDATFVLAQNNLKFAKDSLAALKTTAVAKKTEVLANTKATSQDFINVGMELFNARELDSSVSVWGRVKKSDPLFAMAQNNIASSYILLEKFESAETALGEALKLDPANTLFMNNKKWLEDARAAKK